MRNFSSASEENVYVDPGAPQWTKITLTLPWVVSLTCATLLLTIAKYEWAGKMGHYRPLINQLTSYGNFTVRNAQFPG